MTERIKYLRYIEDTRKHHQIIEEQAKASAEKAIEIAYENGVEITYLEGEEILKVNSNGSKKVIGTVKNNRRKVEIGERTILSVE